MTFKSYNEFHLGDNLIHLHFLRALAKRNQANQFIHYAHQCHLPQLEEAVTDLDNLLLLPLGEKVNGGYGDFGFNAWKNADGYWQHHRDQNWYAEFYLQFFAMFAHRWGLETPFNKRTDLLFDYPAIAETRIGLAAGDFDFLVVNSQPSSGQFRAYDSVNCMDGFARDLVRAGHRVVTTRPVEGLPCTLNDKLTISQIGTLSLHIPHLVMVSTGPSWPTFNVWNQGTVKTRLLLIDCGEDLTTLCPGTVQTNTLAGAREILKSKGLL